MDHGLEINNLVNEPAACSFENGQVNGAFTATYEVTEGSNFITIKTADVTYKGVLVEMTDEAGNNTFCFSAIGDNNHSIWGVKYLQKNNENE